MIIDYNKNGVSVPINLVDSLEVEWCFCTYWFSRLAESRMGFILSELENYIKLKVYSKYSHTPFAINVNNCFLEFYGQTYIIFINTKSKLYNVNNFVIPYIHYNCINNTIIFIIIVLLIQFILVILIL